MSSFRMFCRQVLSALPSKGEPWNWAAICGPCCSIIQRDWRLTLEDSIPNLLGDADTHGRWAESTLADLGPQTMNVSKVLVSPQVCRIPQSLTPPALLLLLLQPSHLPHHLPPPPLEVHLRKENLVRRKKEEEEELKRKGKRRLQMDQGLRQGLCELNPSVPATDPDPLESSSALLPQPLYGCWPLEPMPHTSSIEPDSGPQGPRSSVSWGMAAEWQGALPCRSGCPTKTHQSQGAFRPPPGPYWADQEKGWHTGTVCQRITRPVGHNGHL